MALYRITTNNWFGRSLFEPRTVPKRPKTPIPEFRQTIQEIIDLCRRESIRVLLVEEVDVRPLLESRRRGEA